MHEFSEQPWLTEPEAQALHARALNLLQAGQDAAGAEILLALALARPEQAVYFRDLGLAWQRCGAWDKAWEAYGVAHTLDPQDEVAAALRAECAAQLLSAPEALDIVQAVLARPSTAAAAPYLARARQLRQRLELQAEPPRESEPAHV